MPKPSKNQYILSVIFLLAIMVAVGLAWLGGKVPIWNLAQVSVSLEEQTWQFPLYNWGFSYKDNYNAYSTRFNNYHAGEDWYVPAGTPVYAVANGIVKRTANFNADKDYGGFVAIEHTLLDNSKVVSIYGHLDPRTFKVKSGQTIARGQKIGVVGSKQYNGNWSPHLHFGLRQGAYISSYFAYKGYYPQTDLDNNWLKPRDFILPRLFDQTAPSITINQPLANSKADNFIDIDVTTTDPSGLGRVRVWASSDNGANWSILHQTKNNTTSHKKSWNVTTYADNTFKIIVDACDRFTNCSQDPAQISFTKQIVPFLVAKRPAGTLLKANNTIYLLDKDRVIRPFPSQAILKTHQRKRRVRVTSQQEIETYTQGAPIGFADGTLIRIKNTPTVYLITDTGLKRPFSSPKAFYRQGLSFREVIQVSAQDAGYHNIGPALRENTPLADGLFVKGSGPTVYYITNGQKRGISHPAILASWASFTAIHRVSDNLLRSIPTGPRLPFAEGALVRPNNNPTVYVIGAEQKVPVASPRALFNFGYSFSEVKVVPPQSLYYIERSLTVLKMPF